MERFSYVAPTGRFTNISGLSTPTVDRIALTRVQTHERKPSRLVLARTLPDLPGRPSFSSYADELPGQASAATFRPEARFYLVFSALAALSLIVALDGTSISVALPIIAKALNGSANDAFWVGTSFLLSSTVFQPIYAAFSHIFGRKQLTLIAIALFLAGTLIAGLAQNMFMMLVGRSVQGIGGGGITALTAILVTDLIPLRHRGQWIGVLGAMWAIGSVSGPVIGGSLAKPSLWAWIFFITLPFIAASFVLVAMLIRLAPIPIGFRHKLRRADWGGSVIFAVSMTSILVPLTWGGVQYDWTSWHVIAPVGFGFCGLVILGYHERFVAREPIIPFNAFTNRTTNIAYLTTTLHGMVLWCLLYYQPLYFQAVRGFSPVLSGVALFPATFTVAPTAIVSGLVISKFGCYRWAIWGGWGLTTLGVGLLCAINTDTQLAQVVLTDLATGLGLGSLFPALQFQLQSAAEAKHLATSVAMFAFFRGLGQTLGIAIGGNIFQNALSTRFAKQPLFADDAMGIAIDATAVVQWLQDQPDGDARTVMRTAFTDSIRIVYIVMAGFALLAAVVSLFVKHYDMDRALETEQALAGAEQVNEKRAEAGSLGA
ncbi:hypothetical protein B0A55_10656 [Friedmanniomyces simplex]|uniref:Major facilitator superfamily (MFS) profile domain-containing protein n=1 Tax=Friedmanniomyces simplex TaxID=329884 RepID=A0A4U0WL82_9PEZI|nr:hypothetical protein B0A55_10656 [Friedmanniomyces simplex]